MSPHEPRVDRLPPVQQMLWPSFAGTADLGLVLYGGTAIAMRLGHRPSVDFDFFTDRPLNKDELRGRFPLVTQAVVLQDSPDTLTILVPAPSQGMAPVKVSFFGSIRFGRVGFPDWTPDGVAQVASLDDLLATKLNFILQRIEAKDYIDIAELLRAGVPLDRGLASAQALYGPSFQACECLKALVYFQGGDLDTLSEEVRGTLIQAASAVGALPRVEIVSQSLALSVGSPP